MMTSTLKLLTLSALTMTLVACGGQKQTDSTANPQQSEKKIQPAVKLSPDATMHAQRAWQFVQQVEVLLQEPKIDMLDGSVRQPIRQLTEDWLTQVKMNDAVTEGKYAMCRKTLQSMDAWARALQDNSRDIEKRREMYLRDKALCEDAINHPELGNTDPKKLVNPS